MFSWDARKALKNSVKHGVAFEEASTIFSDPDGLDWADLEHAQAEPRWKRLGFSRKGRVLMVVYTLRRLKNVALKRFASSARGRQAARSAKHMPDRRIDFSDIPESTDAELKRARRVGRPKTGQAKQLIAIRISPRLLAKLRRRAARSSKPYQTLIHELLEKAAARAA
jgi:uncharacterized DUF497 family protein/predicted DNA binding CopG/RHH family protein